MHCFLFRRTSGDGIVFVFCVSSLLKNQQHLTYRVSYGLGKVRTQWQWQYNQQNRTEKNRIHDQMGCGERGKGMGVGGGGGWGSCVTSGEVRLDRLVSALAD